MNKALITTVALALLASSSLYITPAYSEEAAEAAVRIPKSAAETWQAIDKADQDLTAVVKAGRLNEVHHHAFAIRDLVAALPAQSKDLDAAQQKSLAANIKFVATLAQRLDAAGDANDRAAVEINVTKLQGVLTKMRKAR